jgi:hypothetical protein
MSSVYKESFANSVMWFLVAAILGWQGSVQLHDKVLDPKICISNCWRFGYFHVQFIVLGVLMIVMIVVAAVYQKAAHIGFRDCFMNILCTVVSWVKSQPFTSDARQNSRSSDRKHASSSDESDHIVQGRWLHEVLHIIFVGYAFVFWNLIRNDPDRANMLTSNLPVSRLYVQMWVVLIPTVASEIMAVRTYGKLPTNWFVDDAKWALMSVCLKLTILVVTDVIITTDTQMIWSQADDSDSQLRIVLIVATILGVFWMYFWHKVAQACLHDKTHHLLVQSWACLDFPVSLVLISYTAWTVSDRYYLHRDRVSIPLDFMFQVAYSYAVFIGILNTKTSLIMSRAQNTGGNSKNMPTTRKDFDCRGVFDAVPVQDPDDTNIGFSTPDPEKAIGRVVICSPTRCVGFDVPGAR